MATRRCRSSAAVDPDAVLRHVLLKALGEHDLDELMQGSPLTPEDDGGQHVAVTDDYFLVDGTATTNEEDLTPAMEELTPTEASLTPTSDYTVGGVPPSPEPAPEPAVGKIPAPARPPPAPEPAVGETPAKARPPRAPKPAVGKIPAKAMPPLPLEPAVGKIPAKARLPSPPPPPQLKAARKIVTARR